jgi:hypothetical protein
MALRDQLVDVDSRALLRHLGGHDDVDAVRLAVGVLVHPAQHVLEIIGFVEPDTPENTEPTGPADSRGDLFRWRENEDRIVDAEAVTQLGAHQDDDPT